MIDATESHSDTAAGLISEILQHNPKQAIVTIIDNNDAKEDVFTEVFKRVRSLANRKIQNKRAQQWIDNELKMRNITKFKRKVV